MPVAIAVWRKTRFSQTMGEAEPLPGILTFHFTLFVSLQVSGGFPCGATPLANGPRHCGQFWSVEAEAARATQAPSDRIASVARYARISRGQGWVFMGSGLRRQSDRDKGVTRSPQDSACTNWYHFYVISSILSADLDVHGWSRTSKTLHTWNSALASSLTAARPVLIGVV